MNWFKKFWTDDWIEIRINKRILYIGLIIWGLLWAKDYYWMKGAMVGYQYAQEESKDVPIVPPGDGEPGPMDHSQNKKST